MSTSPLCQRISFAQVQQVIHAFYARLQADPQLSHFFKHIADFTEHEYRISCFWWMSMGGKLHTPPSIDMINKHMPLGISTDDLQKWLALFHDTLQEQLEHSVAEEWFTKVLQIAQRVQAIVIDKKSAGIQIQEPE